MIKNFEKLGYKLEVDESLLVARLYRISPRSKLGLKKVFGYRFKNSEHMNTYITDQYNLINKRINEKIQTKEQTKLRNAKEADTVQVGDIFHCSWGWEQTQCDFYQVISKKGKCTIVVRPIRAETVEVTSWASDMRKAVRDEFLGEKEHTHRLNGDSFKISSFQYASKVKDPEKETFYCSWYA